MNDSGIISFVSAIGSLLLVYCFIVGAMFTLRWGTTGLAYVLKHRKKIDDFVRTDIKKSFEPTKTKPE